MQWVGRGPGGLACGARVSVAWAAESPAGASSAAFCSLVGCGAAGGCSSFCWCGARRVRVSDTSREPAKSRGRDQRAMSGCADAGRGFFMPAHPHAPRSRARGHASLGSIASIALFFLGWEERRTEQPRRTKACAIRTRRTRCAVNLEALPSTVTSQQKVFEIFSSRKHQVLAKP